MKFGILCNGNQFQQWQLDTVSLLISGGHTCELLIVNANPVLKPGFIEKWAAYPYSKLLYRIWFRYMMKPEAKNSGDIRDYATDLPSISCITLRKGYAEYFSSDDVAKIRSYTLDFVLRFGFGILKGEILDCARYGIWSYHHDDDRKYRGVPTGFWEIMFDDPINAAILQRLTSRLDSGVILRKGYFATINHSWEANLNNLLHQTTAWPLQVCADIENGHSEFLAVENSPESALYHLPGNLKMIRFLLKVAANKIRFHYRDLFLTEKWNIGIIPQAVEAFVKEGNNDIPEPQWLNLSDEKSLYHADAFGFNKDGYFHIICEQFDYKNAKGILTSFRVGTQNNTPSAQTIALHKEYHLAYPYLFDYKGEYYCIPENSKAGDVDLYRFDTTSGKLIFVQTLIPGLKAVDPSLFFHEGKWWLFFTDTASTNERLHIWYSDEFTGPYISHRNNPVKTDVRSSRPAGKPFYLDGKLLRPAQDCSVRSGRRIVLNQLIKLSADEFVEIPYAIVNPSPHSKYRDGMHTFCVSDGAVIVDGKRELFIWQAFARKLSGKINKILR